jgi:hypothetical protein
VFGVTRLALPELLVGEEKRHGALRTEIPFCELVTQTPQ